MLLLIDEEIEKKYLNTNDSQRKILKILLLIKNIDEINYFLQKTPKKQIHA